jgi:hypothetical protein
MKNAVASDLLPRVSSIEMTPRASIGLPRHAIKHQVALHELIVLPSKLLEDRVWHQVDDSITIDEYPGDRLPVDLAPIVQWLQVLVDSSGFSNTTSLGLRHI